MNTYNYTRLNRLNIDSSHVRRADELEGGDIVLLPHYNTEVLDWAHVVAEPLTVGDDVILDLAFFGEVSFELTTSVGNTFITKEALK